MTAKEVGAVLRVVPRYVTEHLVLVPSFPKPIRLPSPGGKRGHPKWQPEEIEEWVQKHKVAA